MTYSGSEKPDSVLESYERKRMMLEEHLSECVEHERSGRNHWTAFVEYLDERDFFDEGPEANNKRLSEEEIEGFRVRNRINLIETKLNSAESVDTLFELNTKLNSALSDLRTMKRNAYLTLVLVCILLFGLYFSGVIK